MPTYGNEQIEKTAAQSQDDATYISFKTEKKHEVYPAFFVGSIDDAPEIAKSVNSVFDFMPAQNIELAVFPDRDIIKEHNDGLSDSESHLRIAGKIKFEVDVSYKNLDNLQALSEIDPVAWMLYHYQFDTEIADAIDSKLSKRFFTARKNLDVKTRVLLWMFDNNLSNRYVEMSVPQYTFMIDDYRDNNGGKLDTVFLQRHIIKQTGANAQTKYSLIYVDNADGVEFDSKTFKPLGATKQFGVAPDNIAERARLVSWLVGEDNLPVNIDWLETVEAEPQEVE